MIIVTQLRKTCDACPAQWQGKDSNGNDIYIRYRWGVLRVDLNGNTIFSKVAGDDLHGWMDLGELKGHVADGMVILVETDGAEDE